MNCKHLTAVFSCLFLILLWVLVSNCTSKQPATPVPETGPDGIFFLKAGISQQQVETILLTKKIAYSKLPVSLSSIPEFIEADFLNERMDCPHSSLIRIPAMTNSGLTLRNIVVLFHKNKISYIAAQYKDLGEFEGMISLYEQKYSGVTDHFTTDKYNRFSHTYSSSSGARTASLMEYVYPDVNSALSQRRVGYYCFAFENDLIGCSMENKYKYIEEQEKEQKELQKRQGENI